MRSEPSDRYRSAVGLGLELAQELGQAPGPVHLIIGIAQTFSPAFAPAPQELDAYLRDVIATSSTPDAGRLWLQLQAQQTATAWAVARREPPSPEHLLVALVDQAATEVIQFLERMQNEPGQVRLAALRALGASTDLPTLTMSHPAPAGTLDRPALPVAELPSELWAILRARQDSLPVKRIRRVSDLEDVQYLERRAVWRLASRASINDSINYSLQYHHLQAVRRRLEHFAPSFVESAPPDLTHLITQEHESSSSSRRIFHPQVIRGWSIWLRARYTHMRAMWFGLTTVPHRLSAQR